MKSGKRFFGLALALMFLAAGAEEKLRPRRVEGSANVVGMTLAGDVLYTAGWGHRLEWFDVSVPDKPVKLGVIPGVFGRQMTVAGNRLYVTARQQGLWIFDIKDPRRPALLRCL